MCPTSAPSCSFRLSDISGSPNKLWLPLQLPLCVTLRREGQVTEGYGGIRLKVDRINFYLTIASEIILYLSHPMPRFLAHSAPTVRARETPSSDIQSQEEALGPLCQPIESQSQCSSGLGDTLRNKFGREARGSLPVTHYDQALVPVDKQSPTTIWRAGLDYAGDWSSSHRLRHCNSQVIFAL